MNRRSLCSHLLEYDAVAEPEREEHGNVKENTYRERQYHDKFHTWIIFESLVFHHSYLKALIGSSEAAFLAGYHPKNMPVAAHTTNESITAEVLTI